MDSFGSSPTSSGPDETKLYLIPFHTATTIPFPVIQFDLEAPDIQASMDTIPGFSEALFCGFKGQMVRFICLILQT